MLLTDKKQKEFVEWYRNLYGDTSKETGTGKLPYICKEHEGLHLKLWADKVDELLWKDKHKKYTHKWWRTEEYRDVVFNWLHLDYFPTVVDEPYKPLWVEVWWWYDWIAYYEDQFWNRYSRKWNPIWKDELCRYGTICKVEKVGDFDYKVLSEREDV